MRSTVRAGAALAIVLAVAACGSTATSAPTDAPATTTATSAPATVAAGVCSEVTDGSAATVSASIEGSTFIPGTVNAKVGDVITWTNSDGLPHGIGLDDGSCRTTNMGGGQSRSLTFEIAGEFPFHCTVHSDMRGTLVITE